jgi:hypothetical protein
MKRLIPGLFTLSLWGWIGALLWLNTPQSLAHWWMPQALLWPVIGILLTLGQTYRGRLPQEHKPYSPTQNPFYNPIVLSRNLIGAGLLGSSLLLIYHLGQQETVPQLARGLQQTLLPLLYSLLIHLSFILPIRLGFKKPGETP